MKSLWTAISLLLLINLLLLAGVGLWLWGSDRLDAERFHRVVDMIKITKAEEAELQAQEQAALDEAVKQAQDVARVLSVAQGPVSAHDRIAADERERDLINQRLDRMQKEKEDLLRQMTLMTDHMNKQQLEIEAARAEMKRSLEAEHKRANDRDFEQAVAMYEQLKPRQGKEMFQQLLAQGQEEQVVAYLAAMQLRKAAGVLKEFKTDPEIAQATQLVQKLRSRGVDVLPQMPTPANPALRDAEDQGVNP